MAKCSLHGHEDLSWVLCTHIRAGHWGVLLYSHRWEGGDRQILGLLASQPSQTGASQAVRDIVSKTKVDNDLRH